MLYKHLFQLSIIHLFRCVEFSFQGFYLTDDILINTLFAGVLVGVAIAIVIKAGASTGGMDIPPLILNKLFKIPVSISMYVFDSLIVLAQIWVFLMLDNVFMGIVLNFYLYNGY